MTKGAVGSAKVVLNEDVLRGRIQNDHLSSKVMRSIVQDYLHAELGSMNVIPPRPIQTFNTTNQSVASSGSMEMPQISTVSDATAKIQSATAKVEAARVYLREPLQMHNEIQEAIDSQAAELDGMRNMIKEQADTIKDLSAQLFTATHSQSRGPAKTSSGKFVIGDKVYTQIPAGSMNEGLYVEKESRIKNGNQEKTIWSEYSRCKVGGFIYLEPVMLKNTEFYRTFSGDVLQKQEELVEHDGKTYARRRLHVAYESDEEE